MRRRWTRRCPICASEIVYAKEKYQKICARRGSKCKKCQNREISRRRKGISLEKRLGKIKAAKMKEKQSLALRGIPKPKYWIDRMRGDSNPNFGNTWTAHQRELARKRMAKLVKDRGWPKKIYNPTACRYLDKLSKEMGWKLVHAKNGGEKILEGYFVDGYDVRRKIVVEYDEPYHYYANGKLKRKDVERMRDIIKHTGCKFYRYNEQLKTLNEYN